MAYQITNQRALRKTFWEQFSYLSRTKIRGDYPVDTRIAFCNWIDEMARAGVISEALASRATL